MFLVFIAGVCHQLSGHRVDSRRFLRWRLRLSLIVRRRPPARPGRRARHLKLQAWRHGLVSLYNNNRLLYRSILIVLNSGRKWQSSFLCSLTATAEGLTLK